MRTNIIIPIDIFHGKLIISTLENEVTLKNGGIKAFFPVFVSPLANGTFCNIEFNSKLMY